MKKFWSALLLALAISSATSAGEPFRGTFEGADYKIKLVVDLYEESINVPGMSMFGPMNGYIAGGDLYCTWYVSSIQKADEKDAVVHFSNELGSETQEVELTLKDDSLLTLRQKGSSPFKKVVGKKLQKLPSELVFKRVK